MEFRGKSRKGKTRIREHGSVWSCVVQTSSVAFSPLTGLWMLLKSEKDGATKWFRANGDEDFERLW